MVSLCLALWSRSAIVIIIAIVIMSIIVANMFLIACKMKTSPLLPMHARVI